MHSKDGKLATNRLSMTQTYFGKDSSQKGPVLHKFKIFYFYFCSLNCISKWIKELFSSITLIHIRGKKRNKIMACIHVPKLWKAVKIFEIGLNVQCKVSQ